MVIDYPRASAAKTEHSGARRASVGFDVV
jgi:hypothetical protein